MSEEFDFSELRNYLQGQMDLGDAELFLDEPWALTRKPALPGRPAGTGPAAVQRPAMVRRPESGAPIPQPASFNGNQGAMFGSSPIAATPNMPTPREVKRTSSFAFESSPSLESFYKQIKNETVYGKEPSVARYCGPEKPKLMFLLPALKMGENPTVFLQTPVGEMLVRLFANLNIGQESIGYTYFYKSTERNLSPLLDASLKKMLTKELSFIQPEVMICCGQPLFHQLFGRAKNFDDLAGTDLDFSGTKTCAIVDPYKMVNDKQLKWITWKLHIPRSTFFAVK